MVDVSSGHWSPCRKARSLQFTMVRVGTNGGVRAVDEDGSVEGLREAVFVDEVDTVIVGIVDTVFVGNEDGILVVGDIDGAMVGRQYYCR